MPGLPLHRPCVAMAFAGLVAGCATTPALSTHEPVSDAATTIGETSTSVPVVRHGRYTLVELSPESGQSDLMQQVVDVVIPPADDTTVGEALRYVLLRSGYRLCRDDRVQPLYDLPLPAVHLHLGPLPLRQALQLLTGQGWRLSVDDTDRNVCFDRSIDAPPAADPAGPPSPAVAPDAAFDLDPFRFTQPWDAQP